MLKGVLYLFVFEEILLHDLKGREEFAVHVQPVIVELFERDSLLGVHECSEADTVGTYGHCDVWLSCVC